VIIPGANEGILPHVNSIEQVILNLEEERRLMYVAMTRAMERLIITYRKRQEGQAITAPSRFLGEINCSVAQSLQNQCPKRSTPIFL